MMTSHPKMTAKYAVLIAGLIQFVNMTDFMMVMPLGPDFSKALDIPVSEIGMIAGSYTLSAAMSGLVSALFLDQFTRKRALMFFLLGLICATFAGALVWDRTSMLFVRFMAGAFGGPLTALAIALIADWVPPAERGRAMGKMMGGFAAASVLGVPFGLEMSRFLGWQAPFISTGAIGLLTAIFVMHKLPYYPPFEEPLPLTKRVEDICLLLSSRLVLVSYALIGVMTLGGFMIIPNIAAHLQLNLGYPREHMGLLYLVAGVFSFFGMRGTGYLVDKLSATKTSALCTGVLMLTLTAGFIYYPCFLPISVIFVMFMVSMTGRGVCAQTVASKIPSPAHRGAYMSLHSAVLHFASAIGAGISSLVLVEVNGKLHHVAALAMMVILLSALVPVFLWYLEQKLKNRLATTGVPIFEVA